MSFLCVVGILLSVAIAPVTVKALNVDTVPGTVERVIERVPGSPRTGGFYDIVASADGNVIAATVIGPIQLVGLPPIPESPRQVILIDRSAGTVELVSRTPTGGLQNVNPFVTEAEWLSISADGRRVSFVSGATNLDPAATATPRAHTYVYDRATRAVRAIDLDPGIAPSAGMGQLDGSGRRIAYFCTQTPTQPAVPGEFGLCVRDLDSFIAERVYSGGIRSVPRAAPRFSGDGQSIYFGYSGPGLIGGWPNPESLFQAYLFDVPQRRLQQIPEPPSGQSGPTGGFGTYAFPLSADADSVLFGLGEAIRVQRRTTNVARQLAFGAIAPQISASGARIAFFWWDGAGITLREVYIYDWTSGQSRFAGAPPGVTPNNRVCYSRSIFPGLPSRDMQLRIALSGDGSNLFFPSLASNLVAGDEPDSCDLFARSLDAVPALAEPQPVPGPKPAWLALLAVLLILAGIASARRIG